MHFGIPCLDKWTRFRGQIQPKPAVDLTRHGHIRHRKFVAGHILGCAHVGFKTVEQDFGAIDRSFDFLHIALGLRDTNELPEGVSSRGAKRRLLPVHPALCIKAFLEVCRVHVAH